MWYDSTKCLVCPHMEHFLEPQRGALYISVCMEMDECCVVMVYLACQWCVYFHYATFHPSV